MLGATKFGGPQKIRGDCPRIPLWLQAWFWFPDTLLNRHYLTKQSSSDKGLTVVSCPDLFASNHLLTTHAKTCERMLHHRAVYGDNCLVECKFRTMW